MWKDSVQILAEKFNFVNQIFTIFSQYW